MCQKNVSFVHALYGREDVRCGSLPENWIAWFYVRTCETGRWWKGIPEPAMSRDKVGAIVDGERELMRLVYSFGG